MKTDCFGLVKTIVESTEGPLNHNLNNLSYQEIIKLLKIASANRVLFLLCKNIKQYNYLHKAHKLYPLINKIFLRGQEINNYYASLLRKVKRLFETRNINHLIVKTDRIVDHVLSDIGILVGKEDFNKARGLLEEMAINKNILEREGRWHFKFEKEVQLDIHRTGKDWYSDDFIGVADIWKNVQYREFLGNIYPFSSAQIEWILNALNIIYKKWPITYLDLLFFHKSRNINCVEVNKIAEDYGWDIGLWILNNYLSKLGKQVRDLLYVTDLVETYNKFIEGDLRHAVFNIGGGPENTISLLEFLDILEKETGKRSQITFSDWRSSDQKVYISNISKIKKALNWEPKVNPEEGMKKLIFWVKENRDLF